MEVRVFPTQVFSVLINLVDCLDIRYFFLPFSFSLFLSFSLSLFLSFSLSLLLSCFLSPFLATYFCSPSFLKSMFGRRSFIFSVHRGFQLYVTLRGEREGEGGEKGEAEGKGRRKQRELITTTSDLSLLSSLSLRFLIFRIVLNFSTDET